MIVQPAQMDFSNKKFSAIIYGSPGVGKTTLALSAPKPLLFDFDKGISRVNARHRKATSMVATYEELLDDIKSDEFKGYETVVIDTGGSFITYLQDWAMRKEPVNRQKNGGISQKGFGAVKAEFQRLTNEIKTIYDKNVIYVFHSIEEKDKEGNIIQRLLCEGSSKNIVWQPCDLGAFMYVSSGKKLLGFTPTDEYFAKGCYGIGGVMQVPILGDDTPNTFLTDLFEAARQNIADESKIFEEERKAYDTALTAGLKLVSAVKDAKTATGFQSHFKALTHALTSEKEIRAAFAARVKELDLTWNPEAKKYVSKSEPKEDSPAADNSDSGENGVQESLV